MITLIDLLLVFFTSLYFLFVPGAYTYVFMLKTLKKTVRSYAPIEDLGGDSFFDKTLRFTSKLGRGFFVFLVLFFSVLIPFGGVVLIFLYLPENISSYIITITIFYLFSFSIKEKDVKDISDGLIGKNKHIIGYKLIFTKDSLMKDIFRFFILFFMVIAFYLIFIIIS